MKKIIIGLGIFGIFILYSFWARQEQPNIVKPSSLASSTTSKPTTTTSCPPPASTGSTGSGDDEERGDDGEEGGSRHEPTQNAGAINGSSCTSTNQGTNTPPNSSTPSSGQYKDGTYNGSVEDAYYGNVQVSATVSGGKLSSVTFLQYPDTHSDSVMINRQAMPYLQQEAIQAQSAQVQIVSGATFTSQAFIQSLSAALSQAKA